MAKKRKYGNPQKQVAYEAQKKHEKTDIEMDKLKTYATKNGIDYDRALAIAFFINIENRRLYNHHIKGTGWDCDSISSEEYIPIACKNYFLMYDGPIPETENTHKLNELKVEFNSKSERDFSVANFYFTNYLWNNWEKLPIEKLTKHAKTMEDFTDGMYEAIQLGMIKVENNFHNKNTRITMSSNIGNKVA